MCKGTPLRSRLDRYSDMKNKRRISPGRSSSPERFSGSIDENGEVMTENKTQGRRGKEKKREGTTEKKFAFGRSTWYSLAALLHVPSP